MSKSDGYICVRCGEEHFDHPTIIVFMRRNDKGHEVHYRGLSGTEKAITARRYCRNCAKRIAEAINETD